MKTGQNTQSGSGSLFHFEPPGAWQEAALIGLMLMELSWITPWYRSITWVTAATSPMRTFLVLAGALWGSSLVTRLANALRLKQGFQRGLIFGFLIGYVWLATSLLVEPGNSNSLGALIKEPTYPMNQLDALVAGDLLVVVTIVLVAWRGMVLGSEYAGPISVYQSIRLGMLALAVYSLAVASAIDANATGFVVLFLASGLFAMVTARIGVLSRLRGGVHHTFDRGWFLSILAAITAVLAAALAFAWIMLGQMERLLKAMRVIFVAMVAMIAAPIVFLLALINPQMPRIQIVIPTPTPVEDILNTLEEGKVDQIELWRDNKLISDLMPYIHVLIAWGIIIGVLFVLARQFKSWSLMGAADDHTERQSLLDAGGLRKLLAAALLNAARNMGKDLAALGKLRPRERRLAAERVRQIYVLLMELAAELGDPRPEAETPLEFLPELSGLFPANGHDLSLLTQAYVRVRYGQFPETQEELREVESAWSRLKAAGEELKKGLDRGTSLQLKAS